MVFSIDSLLFADILEHRKDGDSLDLKMVFGFKEPW